MEMVTRCSSLMLVAAVMTAGAAGVPFDAGGMAGSARSHDPGSVTVGTSAPVGGYNPGGTTVALLPEVGAPRSGSPSRNRLLGRLPEWVGRASLRAVCPAPRSHSAPASEPRSRRIDPARRRTCPQEADTAADNPDDAADCGIV
ncbi:MAG: hypothetical protein AB7K09_18950 [Planctomycetota bacterium]